MTKRKMRPVVKETATVVLGEIAEQLRGLNAMLRRMGEASEATARREEAPMPPAHPPRSSREPPKQDWEDRERAAIYRRASEEAVSSARFRRSG